MSCEKGAFVADGWRELVAHQRSDYPDVGDSAALDVKLPRPGGWYVPVMGITTLVVAVVLLMESLIK